MTIEEILKDIDRLQLQIFKCGQNLSNNKFIQRAHPAIIEKEKKKYNDFKTELRALKIELKRQIYDFLKVLFETDERIMWNIQYLRDKNSKNEPYSDAWFDEVYHPNITDEELVQFYNGICKK